jgi:hypothetical protein
MSRLDTSDYSKKVPESLGDITVQNENASGISYQKEIRGMPLFRDAAHEVIRAKP